MEVISTDLKEPLLSGPMCRTCPLLTDPLMTVPARMSLPSTMYLSEMENSVLSYSLSLSSLVEVSKLRKLFSKSRFLPVTLETRKMGRTSSEDVMREKRTACSISLTKQGVLWGQNFLRSYFMRRIAPISSSLLIWSR